MRLLCYNCHKSVSNEVPEDTIVRALLLCPECIDLWAAEGKLDLNKEIEEEN